MSRVDVDFAWGRDRGSFRPSTPTGRNRGKTINSHVPMHATMAPRCSCGTRKTGSPVAPTNRPRWLGPVVRHPARAAPPHALPRLSSGRTSTNSGVVTCSWARRAPRSPLWVQVKLSPAAPWRSLPGSRTWVQRGHPMTPWQTMRPQPFCWGNPVLMTCLATRTAPWVPLMARGRRRSCTSPLARCLEPRLTMAPHPRPRTRSTAYDDVPPAHLG